MDSEIEVNGINYRVGRMDAIRQFHVARRLAPLLSGLDGSLEFADKIKSGNVSEGEALDVLGPITKAISTLSDTDADYVIKACLSVCQRQLPSGSGWGPVVAGNGALMYQDMTMPEMLQIIWKVLESHLSTFFQGKAPTSLRSVQ